MGSGSRERLNVGAGDSRWGDVRLDVSRTDGVQVVGDMHALPFEDDRFSEVLVDNVLEHSPDTTGVLAEIHRVLRPGGVAYVYVPYYNSHGAFMDPTHRSFFTEASFSYFTENAPFDHYTDFEFEIVRREFYYSRLIRFIPSRRIKLKIGRLLGDMVLAMMVVLRKPGGVPVEPTPLGWDRNACESE